VDFWLVAETVFEFEAIGLRPAAYFAWVFGTLEILSGISLVSISWMKTLCRSRLASMNNTPKTQKMTHNKKPA